MGRIVLIMIAALVFGAVGSAAPAPVETRAQAILELQAAIEDERRAIELLTKEPPRRQTAQARVERSGIRLGGILRFLSAIPGAAAAEENVAGARANDWAAADELRKGGAGWPFDAGLARFRLKVALEKKLAALPVVRTAKPSGSVAQCSDGKDNDGDGITDWTDEPGCTSAKDVRENSPFTCLLDSTVASGQLVLSGSCTGAFSEVEFNLLDGLQLNGRFDVMHAPSCAPPTVTLVRCTTKTAEQNPRHLVEGRFTTTKRTRGQQARVRFFDQRKRQIGNFTVPVR